jgi:type IV pilus assembly protein PilN
MVRINLLPVRVSKKKEAGRQQLVLFVLVVVLGLIGNFFWNGARARELAVKEKKLAGTKNEIAQLDRIIGEVKDIKDQQQQLREKLGVLGQLKSGRAGPVRMLDELAMVLPKRVWLTKFEERSGGVTFTGQATSIDEISEFMTALKTSRHFRNVELGKTAAKAEKGIRVVDFTLSASVVYDGGAAAAAPAPGATIPAAGR